MRGSKTPIAVAILAGLVIACGGSSDAGDPPAGNDGGQGPAGTGTHRTIERIAGLEGLPEVTLLGPAELGAGRAPTFSWAAVADATTYRLVVLGPDAPRWAWSGQETSVRYGGTAGEDGPSLVAGSWWSVAALDATGASIALSSLRAVSPGTDPGPAPAWGAGLPESAAGPSPSAASSATAGHGTTVTACRLVTPEGLTAALGRTFTAGAPSGLAMGSDDCTFPTTGNADLNLDLAPRSGYLPDLWSPDQRPISGLGEDSFLAKTALDTKVGFVRGDHAVLLTFSFGRVEPAQLIELAKSIDAHLQAAG